MMCLFIRWDGLYPMYAQYARMSNMPALGEKTIQFYLEKTKYYQGKIAAKRFSDRDTKETWNHQAWCFDYNKMDVNLIVSQSIESDNENMRPNIGNPHVAKMVEIDKEEEKQKALPTPSRSKIATPGLKQQATPKTGRNEPATPRRRLGM